MTRGRVTVFEWRSLRWTAETGNEGEDSYEIEKVQVSEEECGLVSAPIRQSAAEVQDCLPCRRFAQDEGSLVAFGRNIAVMKKTY